MPSARSQQTSVTPAKPYSRSVHPQPPARQHYQHLSKDVLLPPVDPSREFQPYTRELVANPKKAVRDSPAFPVDLQARARFLLPNKKQLTAHQWKVRLSLSVEDLATPHLCQLVKVYDILMKVPLGKVVTYATISNTLGSSPQAVGGALKANPFAPSVPCHRVIASTGYVGGYQGEWQKGMDQSCALPDTRSRKLRLLEQEGVLFDDEGFVLQKTEVLWTP